MPKAACLSDRQGLGYTFSPESIRAHEGDRLRSCCRLDSPVGIDQLDGDLVRPQREPLLRGRQGSARCFGNHVGKEQQWSAKPSLPSLARSSTEQNPTPLEPPANCHSSHLTYPRAADRPANGASEASTSPIDTEVVAEAGTDRAERLPTPHRKPSPYSYRLSQAKGLSPNKTCRSSSRLRIHTPVTVQSITKHPDVVGRSVPGHINLDRRHGHCRKAGRNARRLSVIRRDAIWRHAIDFRIFAF